MTEDQAKEIISIIEEIYHGVCKLDAVSKRIAQQDSSFDSLKFSGECALPIDHYYHAVLKPYVFQQFPHLDLSQDSQS